MKVKTEGSVRVDLLGGTLDIVPINLILRDTVTLNVATSLKAKVEIETISEPYVEIISKDYKTTTKFLKKDFTNINFDGEHFGPLSFICQILAHFDVTTEVRVTLESGSPPGAGLGGSSSMGVTIYKALCEFTNKDFYRLIAINTVQAIEAKILNKGPCGYQDYYPALFGGILALRPTNSEIVVEQLYTEDFKTYLENNFTLIYSGTLRLSAINNWEVYKSFFDNQNGVREGLSLISSLANQAYKAIVDKKFDHFKDLLCQEGAQREKLFSNIVTKQTKALYEKLLSENLVQGMKVCGAGGGGCFIVAHAPKNRDKIIEIVGNTEQMEVLSYLVDQPLVD